MLLHLLGSALPLNVIQSERRKASSVAKQLLAAAPGAERCPRLKAPFQSVFTRKILVDGCRLHRSTMQWRSCERHQPNTKGFTLLIHIWLIRDVLVQIRKSGHGSAGLLR
jgi:hypothetical protein